MIDREYVIMGCISLGTLLYPLGGKSIKALRRFVLPLILGVSAYILSENLIRGIGVWFLSTGVFCLPYGHNSPIWIRGLTILAHGLCLSPLVWGMNGILMIIPPVGFALNYWLSRKFSWWTWKVVEAANGFSISVTLVLMSLWKA